MQATKTSPQAGERTQFITAQNIQNESYYNLVQLCRITGWADPIAALKCHAAAGCYDAFKVERDECGNIVSGRRAFHSGLAGHRLS